MRNTLINRSNIKSEIERWNTDIDIFTKDFKAIALYPD
jgi:hypothetical protein